MLSHQDLLKAGEGGELESAMPIGAVTQGWPRLPRRDAGRASGPFTAFWDLDLAVPNLD